MILIVIFVMVGYIKKDKTLSVKIPAGIDSGDRIRLSGEGEPGYGNNPNGIFSSR